MLIEAVTMSRGSKVDARQVGVFRSVIGYRSKKLADGKRERQSKHAYGHNRIARKAGNEVHVFSLALELVK